jgi:hypothetical protein
VQCEAGIIQALRGPIGAMDIEALPGQINKKSENRAICDIFVTLELDPFQNVRLKTGVR